MKKMTKGMLMTALICGAVYLGGSPVYASELQEFALDEYVVTAARTETKLVDTPANISVVDSQTIEERHYQDVSEVLKDVPGANVMDAGTGAYENVISLNGDTRVLVLVDGKRVGFASGTSTGAASYDMNLLPDVNLIERVEVLKGAGGALYGSDAVGGVVNIITKKADRSFGKISVTSGSQDTKDLNAIYSVKEGKTGFTISASKNKQGYYKFKDVVSGKNLRWPGLSKYENDKLSLKLEQELSSETNLTIGYDYSNFEGYSPGNIDNYNGVSFNDIETSNIYAKYDWNTKGENVGYLQVYHNIYDYFSESADGAILWGDKKETTNGIDFQQSFMISNTNKLIIGSSWYDTDVDNKNNYNESVDNIAFFINDTWEFLPSWTLNTGIRYDNHSNAGDETTFSAGLNKKINDFSHAYVNWGQVFKAPSTGDLFAPNGGDPDLKPETGDTWTIGYNTQLGNKTNIGVNYFKSDLKDAIAWEDTGIDNDGDGWTDYEARNVDKQKKQGVELTLNHTLNDYFDIEASYTYIRVRNDENNGMGFTRDPYYVPNMYRVGIKYHKDKWNANAYLRYATGADTNFNISKYCVPYAQKDYFTVDVAVTYQANKDWSFYAKGYNLFNESYAERGGTTSTGSYRYPAQSRRFIVGAEYKF